MIETVIQHSRDRTVRIVRRRRATHSFQDYIVEQLIDGTWIRSKNGPWDRLYNARYELRSLLRNSS